MIAQVDPIIETKSVADKSWSYADLEALPEDQSRLVEIYDGERVERESPNLHHQQIIGRLAVLLTQWIARNEGKLYLSPIDLCFDSQRVFIPDLSFVSRERLQNERIEREDGQCLIAAPDLIIEVLSPSTARHDRVRKTNFYAQAAVARYWLIDPDAQSFEALILDSNRYAIEATADIEDKIIIGPGFVDLNIDLEALFAA